MEKNKYVWLRLVSCIDTEWSFMFGEYLDLWCTIVGISIKP